MDLKTGVNAYLNLGGFYVDTSWIGTGKVGNDFPGLYWGIKNLVAQCGDCGKEPCASKFINKALKAFAWNDYGKFKMSELDDTKHVSKDGINSLDKEVEGDDMPTGDPETACYAKAAPAKPRRDIFGDDDDDNDDDDDDDDDDEKKINCQPNAAEPSAEPSAEPRL